MKILIVEDDYLQSESLIDQLNQNFKATIELIDTESDFRQRIEEIVSNPPDIILLDVMLRWKYPSPEITITPDDVKKDGIYTAGFRCKNLLYEKEGSRKTPIILYTVLDKIDVVSNLTDQTLVFYVPKDNDVAPLIHQIKKILRMK